MTEKVKLFNKLSRRLGMKAIDKVSQEIGTIKNFHLDERFDGEFVVTYVIEFDHGSYKELKDYHETNVILLKDTQA
jgi:hypothetical protein